MARMPFSIRSTINKALTSEAGEDFSLVRVPRDLARRLNRLAGTPIATRAELEERAAAAEKLRSLRSVKAVEEAKVLTAPVLVYFEKGRNQRELSRVEDLLKAKDVKYTLSDITGDDATLSFVLTQAKCEKDNLPIVFVGGDVVGTYNELVAFDVAGKLDIAIYGESRKPKISAHS